MPHPFTGIHAIITKQKMAKAGVVSWEDAGVKLFHASTVNYRTVLWYDPVVAK